MRPSTISVLLSSAALWFAPAVHAGSKELLVTDRGTNSVFRYQLSTGAFLGELIGPGNPLSGSELDEPVAMAFAPDGSLLVASRGNGRVVRYDVDTGAFLGDFASGLDQPNDILVYNNQVFVSSLGPTGFDGDVVYRFNADGSLSGTIGVGGPAEGRSGLAVGADGKLYVGSFFDGRVLRYNPSTGDPDGADSVGTFGFISPEAFGTGYLAFANPNELLAVGLFTANVVKLDAATGANLGEFIPAGVGLAFPADILVVQESASLLVTSIGNDDPTLPIPLFDGYISKFDLATGAPINPLFIAGGGLQQPTGLLVRNTLPGDLNDDGFVGQDDLNFILGAWGRHVPLGTLADISGDGFIGQDDLNVVLANWGRSSSVATATTLRIDAAVVPETSSLLLLASTGVGMALALRRRRAAARRNQS